MHSKLSIRHALIALAMVTVAMSPTSSAANPAAPPFCSASGNAGSIFICPAGDGQPLSALGSPVLVRVVDAAGVACPGFPALNVSLQSLAPGALGFCATPAVPNGSAACCPTSPAGATRIDQLWGGGFTPPGSGVQVFLRVPPVLAPVGSPPIPTNINSPDINGDGVVDLADVGPFAVDLVGPYNYRSDFFPDGVINLADIGIFVPHIGHACP